MNEDEKERLVLRFIMNCYGKGLKKSQVQVIITGIRQWFRFNLVDCCAFNSEFVKQGIQSTKLKPNELRQKAIEVKENGKIPFTVEMLKSMREEYFIDGLWSNSEDLVDKAAYLATAICLNFGVRVGSVSLRDGSEGVDHNIHINDISFVVKDVNLPVNGNVFKNYYSRNKLRLVDVSSVSLLFFTEKGSTNSGVVTNRNASFVGRNNEDESQLLEDIVQWVLCVEIPTNGKLFSWKSGSGSKTLTRREISDRMKSIGEKHGIPAHRICPTSLRKGFATSSSFNGMTDQQLQATGNWKSIRVMNKHYKSNINQSGLLSQPNQLTNSMVMQNFMNQSG